MSLKDLWRLDWRAGSRHVVVLVDVVKDVRKRGTVALTYIIVGLRLEWGGFGYALVVRLFQHCPEIGRVRE